MKDILLVTDKFVWPVDSGERIRTWNFIKALSRRHRLSLLYSYQMPTPEKDIKKMEDYFVNIWGVEYSRNSSSGSLHSRIGSLVKGIPWEIISRYQPAIDQKLDQILQGHRFDYVMARYIYQAQYLFQHCGMNGTKMVVDLDDIETKKMERQLRLAEYRNFCIPPAVIVSPFSSFQYHPNR